MALYVRHTGDSDSLNLVNRSAADTYPLEPIGNIVWLATAQGTAPVALRYIYNGEASSSMAAKDLIVVKTSSTTVAGVSFHAYHPGVGVLGGSGVAALRVLGVARYTIAAGSYGYITCWGRCTATAAGAIAAGALIVTAANADVDTIGAGDGSLAIGYCVVLASGAGDVDVMLTLPNVVG